MGLFAHIGVVIVTHRSAGEIKRTLAELPTQEFAAVVVVDNDSPDDTVAVVEGLALPKVTVLRQPNLGFGAGNDAGRAQMPDRVEFVLFLNPDCRITGDSVAALDKYMTAHPKCGLVAPRLTSAEGVMTSGGALPSPLTELQQHLPRPVAWALPRRQLPPNADRSGPVGYVEGACMLARLAAYDAVRGFDDRYFLCFEEIDLAHRLHDAGWTVDLCADAWAEHDAQASRRQVPLFSEYHKYRSQRLYLERWYGRTQARAFAWVATASWWIRRRLGKLDAARFRVLKSAVAGREFQP